jgi:hypothetical protein
MFQTYRLVHRCILSNIIKPRNGWPLNVIDVFHAQLNGQILYARFFNYNAIREISEVEIRVKGSKTGVVLSLSFAFKKERKVQKFSFLFFVW